mmetsp:Transcript_26711/g.100463  ORF Transcript_26711/g.100463 Transcript_26711/m.100463 type:complete len:224 (+) Transcript_26711:1744-2415(+)
MFSLSAEASAGADPEYLWPGLLDCRLSMAPAWCVPDAAPWPAPPRDHCAESDVPTPSASVLLCVAADPIAGTAGGADSALYAGLGWIIWSTAWLSTPPRCESMPAKVPEPAVVVISPMDGTDSPAAGGSPTSAGSGRSVMLSWRPCSGAWTAAPPGAGASLEGEVERPMLGGAPPAGAAASSSAGPTSGLGTGCGRRTATAGPTSGLGMGALSVEPAAAPALE